MSAGRAAPEPSMRAAAVIDTGAVERNCARLAGAIGDAELCAVVKANGYGHGMAESAAAALAGGASRLAVAAGDEASALRAHLPEARIMTLGALTPAELERALEARSEVAVWQREFLDLVRARGDALGIRPAVHIKFDTGMGRLGERDPRAVSELVDAAASSDNMELAGLWTHFATADEPGSSFFDTQLLRFTELAETVRGRHQGLLLHAANSAATLRDPASHFGMVRCGIAVYGLDPFQENSAARRLEPALELHSHVAAVKRFERGDSAGYGQVWRAHTDTTVGVLPIGYGDGVRRDLTNNGEVLVAGRRYPIVGTVSMDNITVELGPDTDIRPGEPATLIGVQGDERISAEDVARRMATINYEVTTGISQRVPRLYRRS